ncbi:MAG: hypothetical protein AAGC44_05105 [Planctomycetota bacterium]
MANNRYLNGVLTAIALLLAMNLWVNLHQKEASASLDPATEAMAQGTVSPAQQREAMIREINALGDKIDAIGNKLTDGSIRVKVDSMPESD